MIKNRTVFVLGAGASVPFGYPTGAELRSFIVEQLWGQGQLVQPLVDCGYDNYTTQLFAEEFEKSGFQSIDRFLAARPDTADVGKLAIAAAIKHFQNEQKLYLAAGRHGTSDWYGHLWNLMAAGVDRADDVTGNAVSFITFNYDVSLERFLFNAIRAGFGLDDAHALKIAQSIPVHHVYGALAPTERDRYLSHDHWGALKTEVLQACARQIHVMPHQRPARDERCAELLSQAFNTVFLGFGFDEMNCLRLGVKEVMRGQDPLRLPFGTALGTYGEERDVAEERISSNVMGRLFDLNCLQVLRKLSARIV